MKRITPEEHARRMELYNQGLQDIEIAKILFTCPPNIRQWRVNNGLPTNKYNKYAKNEKLRMELYNQGFSDSQIGKAVKCTKGAILHWRRKNNLPANNHLKASLS